MNPGRGTPLLLAICLLLTITATAAPTDKNSHSVKQASAHEEQIQFIHGPSHHSTDSSTSKNPLPPRHQTNDTKPVIIELAQGTVHLSRTAITSPRTYHAIQPRLRQQLTPIVNDVGGWQRIKRILIHNRTALLISSNQAHLFTLPDNTTEKPSLRDWGSLTTSTLFHSNQNHHRFLLNHPNYIQNTQNQTETETTVKNGKRFFFVNNQIYILNQDRLIIRNTKNDITDYSISLQPNSDIIVFNTSKMVKLTHKRYINVLNSTADHIPLHQTKKWIRENQTNLRTELQHRPTPQFIVEVSKERPKATYPAYNPTPDELDAAWKLYNQTYEAMKDRGWFNYTKGREAGYTDPNNDFHYYHPTFTPNDENLEPERPEFLMYAPNPENTSEHILVGVMYQMDAIGKTSTTLTKDNAGPLTIWHHHLFNSPLCFLYGTVPLPTKTKINEPDKETDCKPGVVSMRSPEMFHVWFIDHPDGQFATRMNVDPKYIKEPTKMTEKEFKHRMSGNHSTS